jgi:homoserine O-acetyltransferase
MQALCYAIEYPKFAKHIFALATTAYTRPWAIAFNKIAIEAIRNDKQFKNGEYDPKDIAKDGLNGLAVARMAGHVSYLSPYSMKEKFDNNYVDKDGLYELFGRYEVERYLEYNAYNFPRYFDPLSYLFIVKTMNIFNSARGGDSLKMAYSKVEAKLHLISFSGDMLFFPYEMEQIRDIMVDIGKKDLISYKMIHSDYGHDAFLVEVAKYGQYLKEIIDE